MQRVVRSITALVLILSCVLAPLSLSAQETPASEAGSSAPLIGIRPAGSEDGSKFEIELGPGESHTFSVVIGNYGEAPIAVRTYVADLAPSKNGGLLMLDSEAERTGHTLWFDYPTEEITLQPGEEITRDMTVSVPQDAEPGQYVSAVALETVEAVQQVGSFTQYFRKVVSIYTVVPGDLYADFSLGAPIFTYENGRAFIVIPVANTGRIRLDLQGTYKLANSQGGTVSEGKVNLAPIYMGQETEVYISVAAAPPAGEYAISFQFSDSSSGKVVGSDDVAISISDPPSSKASVVTFEDVQILPNADPIVFANVSVNVLTSQNSFPSTRLTLLVYLNGDLVEEFVLADNLALGTGDSVNVSQRYLPAEGWQSGTYSFSLKIESTAGGQTSLLLEQNDVVTLEVP